MQTGKRGASWGVLLIVMLVLAGSTKRLTGQNPGATSGPVTPAVDHSWPEVNLNVIVLDAHDVPQKVDERKFQLFEDGVERPLQFRGSPDSPVSLTVMMDSSGSVFKRKDEIIATVKAIVKGLPDGSEVAVIDFNGRAYIDLDFTDASKADLSLLDRLQASGGTALFDALIETEEYILTRAKYARRALVILSDGQDNASNMSIKGIHRKMEQPGAPVVYACLTSRTNILQRKSIAGNSNMTDLARNGGGIAFNLDSGSEFVAAQILDAVRTQVVLQFTAANAERDGNRRTLEVRLPVKNLKIYGLPIYFAPAY